MIEVVVKIKGIPENLIDEVIDFIQFLKRKKVKESIEITIASESSLSKDWLSGEEEKAWQNL